jgi:transcriptional regulator with XRE-family HTH domain
MSTRKTPTQKAILDLRDFLHTTQENLARALNVTRLTVARWETQRPPSGTSLWRLFEFARKSGAPEIAAVFQKAMDREKQSFTYPVGSDSQALKDLRIVADNVPAMRKHYLAVLVALLKAHRHLLRLGPAPEGWSEEDEGFWEPQFWQLTQIRLDGDIHRLTRREEEGKK